MQLKLLPPHPLPTVLFTLAYPAPPANLPLPASYAALLKLVVEENLLDSAHGVLDRAGGARAHNRHAGPVNGGQGSLTPHALDRATWIAAVLSEVVFDLSDGARRVRVVCRYVDGREVGWVWDVPEGGADGEDDAEAQPCYAALRSVLRDVDESAAAGERERREREKRHAYHDRFAFGERDFGRGQEEAKERKRRSAGPGMLPMQRSYSHENVREQAQEARRRSLEEEMSMGHDAEAHVPGHVETRRGKGKRSKDAKKVEKEEDAKEGKKEKGKHKKKGSLLSSLVALASFISPRNSRARSPPHSLAARAGLDPPMSHSVPASRSPSPAPPHVVHPQLTLTPHIDPSLSSSDLRRRARATLVDVFRRYVIAKLQTPHALPPRVPLTRAPRRVRSTESNATASAGRRLRSVGSALTTRSSNLSEASMRVHSVSRSSSVGVLRPHDGAAGAWRGLDADALSARLGEGEGDEDEDDEDEPFGRSNEGGYVTWVTRSLLARVEAEMREMRVVLESMHTLPLVPPRHVPSMGRSVGARMGFSPIEGPLLSSAGVSPPISGFSGIVGEWDAAGPAVVDESALFFDGFDDELEEEEEEAMEDIPLTEESTEDEDHTSSSAGSTETDGSSVHTPSETTIFDQACIQAQAGPERGEYFTSVQGRNMEFDTPPRRPVLTKQPPLPSQLTRGAPPVYRPSLSPLSTSCSPPQSLTYSPNSALSSPVGSPGSPSPSTLPLAAYTALAGERARLLGILARLAGQNAAAKADESQLLNVLEVKSRRRAWSNRAFMGSAAVRFCGLATPDRPSLLATAKPITVLDLEAEAKELVDAQLECVEGVRKKKRGSLVVTTAESNILRLFPVCEEEEDDSDNDTYADADRSFLASSPFALGSPVSRMESDESDAEEEDPAREDTALWPLDSSAPPGRGPPDDDTLVLSDAEGGLLGPLSGFAPLTRQPSRRTSVPVRPRTRTRSMSMGTVTASSSGPLLPAPVTMGLPPPAVPLLGPISASYPGTLTSSHAPFLPAFGTAPYALHANSASTADLLRDADAEVERMEFGMLEPQTKVELFDVYSGDEGDDETGEVEGSISVDVTSPSELPSLCRRRGGDDDGWMPAAYL